MLPLRYKVTENKSNDNTMKLKKLKPQSLGEALRDMAVGETCVAPDGYTVQTVRKTCTTSTPPASMYSSLHLARGCRQSPAYHDARRLPCEHRPSRSLHRNAGRGTFRRAPHNHRTMETRRINSAAHIQGQRTATLYRLRPHQALGMGNKVLTVK